MFFYEMLEKIVEREYIQEGATNRNLLIMALFVLLSIAILRLLIFAFGNSACEKNISVKFILFGTEYNVDALVDSGNLARDPLDLSPVMLLKPRFSRKIFPYGVPELQEIDSLSEKLKKRMRIIPIKNGSEKRILCGIKADGSYVKKGNKYEKISITIAFDKEGGSYGGLDALLPTAALDNI